jgi:dihydroorotate dehydrogenase (fumarate)
LVPQLSIGSLEALYDGEFFNPFGGTATITTTVSNTGNVSLGADVVAGVNGIFGIPIAQAPAIEVPELLPGTTRTYTFEVTGVGAWVYLNPYVKLVGTIDPDALDPGELPSLERGVTLFVVPWHFLLLLVIVGVLMIRLRSRARINEQREKEWVAYAAAQAAQEKQDSK